MSERSMENETKRDIFQKPISYQQSKLKVKEDLKVEKKLFHQGN